jgi:hypothetical protein
MVVKPIKNVDESYHYFILLFIDMAQQQLTKQRLIYSILKFLDTEIQAESENVERRESIEGKLNMNLTK